MARLLCIALGPVMILGAMAVSSPPASASTITVTRVSGDTRDETAIAASYELFPNGGAKCVVLASDANFPDALAGAPLASAKDGPLLLVPPTGLPADVAQEISRVAPEGSTVYILGGTDAIPSSVDSTLSGIGFTPDRLAGADRFGTAVAIADALGDPTTVFEATGLDFADGLSAGAAAAAQSGVVLLTDGSTQAPETATYLSAHPGKDYAIGGPAATADPSATAIAGADRYATAVMVATTFFPGDSSSPSGPSIVGFASGEAFPDALSGGANIGAQGGPLLLVPSSGPLPSSLSTYLDNTPSITTGYLYGGPAAVGDDVLAELDGSAPSGQPSGPGYSAALQNWNAGASAPSVDQGQYWQAAETDLQEGETSDQDTSGYPAAINELAQLISLPDAMDTPQQQAEAGTDTSALDTFFDTPGLYS
jgi:hypothetical protein